MTALDPSPRAAYTYRVQRRWEIVTVGGMDAVVGVADALRNTGFAICEFAADMRDGVPYSSVTCTVALAYRECDAFAASLSRLEAVVAVAPR